MVSSVLGQEESILISGSLVRRTLNVVEKGIWTLPMVVAKGTSKLRKMASPMIA